MEKEILNEEDLFNDIFEESKSNQSTINGDILDKNEVALQKKENEIMQGLDARKREQVLQLSKKLDDTNELTIKEFGSTLQNKLGSNSEKVLEKTKTTNTGDVGELLNNLMFELKDIGKPEDSKLPFFGKIFKKASKVKHDIESEYLSVSSRVDGIVDELNKQNDVLKNDFSIISEIMEQNQQLEVATDIYIKAGDLKLEELRMVTIPKIKKELETNPNVELEQELMEKSNYLDRLDKRVMDLRLTQQILKQSYPQLTLMRQANQVLSDKIDSSITSTIPIWKNQLALRLQLKNQEDAIKAQKNVTDTTNKMLKSNADLLHDNVVETAIQNERGIVDVETIEYTQQKLLDTIKETIEVQNKGRQDREIAKNRLIEMETEMKEKLLEMANEMNHQNNDNSRKVVRDATERISYDKNGYEDYLS